MGCQNLEEDLGNEMDANLFRLFFQLMNIPAILATHEVRRTVYNGYNNMEKHTWILINPYS